MTDDAFKELVRRAQYDAPSVLLLIAHARECREALRLVPQEHVGTPGRGPLAEWCDVQKAWHGVLDGFVSAGWEDCEKRVPCTCHVAAVRRCLEER